MNDLPAGRSKRTAIIIAVAGIFIELMAIALIASKRVPVGIGAPLVILGMLLAFVPLFVLARRARRP